MEQLLMVMDLLMGFIATGMVYMSKETVPHFADWWPCDLYQSNFASAVLSFDMYSHASALGFTASLVKVS